MKQCLTLAILVWAFVGLSADAATAQELTPRSYWPAPKGTKVAVAGYAYSFGDVLTDPSLPITGVDSRIHSVVLAYLQTISLWGRTANFVVELPYVRGTTEGALEETPRRRDFSGIGDLGVTLSVNLRGAPTMSPVEFQALRADPHPVLGASIKMLVPTGNYDADKLINVGANRWAVKPELGFMIPVTSRWLLELELGTWFFRDNDEFLGVTREQKPITAFEVHVVRRFRPGFWGALNLNYFTGGQSTVGGELRADLQRNSRIGVTVVVPIRGRHAVKVGYSSGVVTESGGDFEEILLSYQVLFR
jgi:hypothetical protein